MGWNLFKMKERFIEFLEKNNCLEQFKQNISYREDFDVYCNRTWNNNSQWVTLAFIWMISSGGDKLWRPLHNQWERLAPKYQQELDLELNSNN